VGRHRIFTKLTILHWGGWQDNTRARRHPLQIIYVQIRANAFDEEWQSSASHSSPYKNKLTQKFKSRPLLPSLLSSAATELSPVGTASPALGFLFGPHHGLRETDPSVPVTRRLQHSSDQLAWPERADRQAQLVPGTFKRLAADERVPDGGPVDGHNRSTQTSSGLSRQNRIRPSVEII